MEVKFSLFTLTSKEPEVPSIKAWWCRITLKEQGTFQALEKRLKTKVNCSNILLSVSLLAECHIDNPALFC